MKRVITSTKHYGNSKDGRPRGGLRGAFLGPEVNCHVFKLVSVVYKKDIHFFQFPYHDLMHY